MPRSRRAASKEALKNLQLLSSAAYDDDESEQEAYEVPSDDDVLPIEEMPPKKKYRLSYRKSSADRDVLVLKTVKYGEETLQLDAWPEDLSPAQLEMHNKSQKEINEMNAHLDQITKQLGAEVIYQGEQTTVFQIGSNPPGLVYPTKAGAQNVVLQPTKGSNPNSYQLVMDARLGLVVGTIVPTSNVGTPQPQQVTQQQTQKNVTPPTPTRQTRARRTRATAAAPPPPPPPPAPVQQKVTPQKTPATPVQKQTPAKQSPVPLRPAETTAVGGLSAGSTFTRSSSTNNVVDLTSDDGRPAADSREISFNKLQGKTFPSLVVVARPHLRVKEVGNTDRNKLDAKVKSVLMHVPTKFTEWLIQQGLVRSEQSCSIHPSSKLKLGMYSDVSKFPYSGGYVWISECCPQRFVSVFSGSLFEGSPHPPSVILKLMYHWACQTNVQNVVQWVKVDNLYVKGMYTCLRAVCTVALHTHLVPLGGPGKRVEVGVISLGTTSQDGQQRQVKVEVLGLLEPDLKLIRLRAVEPLAEGDRNYKKRFSKILEPLVQWVHPESLIITDLTVDKGTLHQMGFAHVQQSTSTDHGSSNHTVMEYLRRIVPRMFQNTLSLLSRQIIQQFLDELVWREWFGPTPSQAFDSLVMHLSEQTRADSGQSLIMRLNKVAVNPFKNWSIGNMTVVNAQAKTVESSSLPSKRTRQRARQATPTNTPVAPAATPKPVSPAPPVPVMEPMRPPRSMSPDVPEQMVPLENYYYGTIEGQSVEVKGSWTIKCSMCKSNFSNNLKLMGHLFSHAHSVTGNVQQCRYCLSSVATQEGLAKHISTSHPYETRFADGYVCMICEMRFANSFMLGKHMSKEHVPSELPYQCGTCGFRCSSHRQAIDHFYACHDYGSTIQCPFCLKSTTVWSGGRILPQNLNFFMQHLQKHQKKALAKKCNRCALWFVQKDILKDHQTKMHASMRRTTGMIPWSAPRNALMVPKSKQDKHAWENDEELNLSNLTVCAPSVLLCKECKNNITTAEHFQTLESCVHCQYTTCCQYAMNLHGSVCKDLQASLPIAALSSVMYCVCGYSDKDGNTLAKHLAECERKSAYPSEEAAKTAAVTHNMLDVLGLVRRPEERAPTIENEPKKAKTKPNIITEVIELDDDDVPVEINKPKRRKLSEKDGSSENKLKEQKMETETTNVPETITENESTTKEESAKMEVDTTEETPEEKEKEKSQEEEEEKSEQNPQEEEKREETQGEEKREEKPQDEEKREEKPQDEEKREEKPQEEEKHDETEEQSKESQEEKEDQSEPKVSQEESTVESQMECEESQEKSNELECKESEEKSNENESEYKESEEKSNELQVNTEVENEPKEPEPEVQSKTDELEPKTPTETNLACEPMEVEEEAKPSQEAGDTIKDREAPENEKSDNQSDVNEETTKETEPSALVETDTATRDDNESSSAQDLPIEESVHDESKAGENIEGLLEKETEKANSSAEDAVQDNN